MGGGRDTRASRRRADLDCEAMTEARRIVETDSAPAPAGAAGAAGAVGAAEAAGRAETAEGDWVVPTAQGVDVWTKTEMRAWQPRKHRRLAIVLEGERHYVERVRREGKRWCYSLTRWPDSLTDLPGGEVTYGAALIEARTAGARVERLERVGSPVATVLAPFVGFLWADTKARLHLRTGIEPRTATRHSIAIEAGVMLFVGTVLFILGWSTPNRAFWAWMALLSTDLLARFGSLLRDESPGLGLGEWPTRIPSLLRAVRDAARGPTDAYGIEYAAAQAKAHAEARGSAEVAARMELDRVRCVQIHAWGDERVFLEGSRRIVHAVVARKTWEVRPLPPYAIVLDGARYKIAAAEPCPPTRGSHAVRYVLEPWPEELLRVPFVDVRYDEAEALERTAEQGRV